MHPRLIDRGGGRKAGCGKRPAFSLRRAGGRSFLGAELRQAPLRLLDALGVGLVRGDLLVNLDRLGALVQASLVNPGRAQSGVVLRLRVPLKTALEVARRTVVVLISVALVEVAELI